jgi:integrase
MAKRRAKGEGGLIKIKGCKIWYAQYYEDGRQIRVSTGKRVKQKALPVLRRLMGKSESGEVTADQAKVRYGDLRAALLASYVEKGNKSLQQRADGSESIVGLPQLDDFFGFKPKTASDPGNPGARLSEVNNTDKARKFAKDRRAAGAGPAMINRSLSCWRRMLHIAHEDRKVSFVAKIRLQKEPAARKGFLNQEKFDELVKVLPTHLRPLVLFLYWCGTRLGEALQIEWPQVDLEHRLIHLEEDETKSGDPRFVPLPAVLVNLLQEITPKVGRVFDGTNLRTEWARACAAVGLGTLEKVKSDSHNGKRKFHVWERYSGLIVHDLRRSAVRNLRRAGVPESVAMKISGHKTRSIFLRYDIANTDDLTEAMRRVETSAAANGNGQIITVAPQPALPAPAAENDCKVPAISVRLVKIGQQRSQRTAAKL